MAVTQPWVPERAEVISIDHNPTGGDAEIPDAHPLLVISPRNFNERTGLVIGFPLTHSERHKGNQLAVEWQRNKSEPISYVLCHQPKSYDWKAGRAKRHDWGTGNNLLLKEALEVLDSICGITDLLQK